MGINNTISVICTVYNTKEYLLRCIESVLCQTHTAIEFIIVDDGSTDGSTDIIKEYISKDNRVKMIRQENQGHSEARNVGLANATSDYIYFLDSDDYIHPRTLEVLFSNLIENDADISIGNCIRYNKIPDQIDNNFKVLTPNEVLKRVTYFNFGSDRDPVKLPLTATWNKIFKREIFDNIKFPSGYTHDDNFTVHRIMAAAKRIVFTYGITYFYTLRQDSIVTKGLYRNPDMILAYVDRIKFFEENNMYEYLSDTCSYYLYVCYKTYMTTGDPSVMYSAREFCKLYKNYVKDHIRGKEYYNIITCMKTIVMYIDNSVFINGINTWLVNFCKEFYNEYLITIITDEINPRFYNEVANYAKCIEMDKSKTYTCNILVNHFDFKPVPSNIKADSTYILLHCDYGAFPEEKVKNIKLDPDGKYISVSELAAKNIRERFGVNCLAIEGLFMPKPEKKRVYKFITPSRPLKEKGIERVFRLAYLLKRHNINFQWLLFFDKDIHTAHFKAPFPEIINCGAVPHDLLMQYIGDADYLVQLSDNEGFCCSVHEALLMGTPVITTDIPIFDCVKDGYNGYKLPLDMKNIDVRKIINNIPNDFEYESKEKEIKKKWRKIFDEGIYDP